MLTIIMAGGRGTRISELFPDIPKPLIPFNNIPVLEHELCSLRDQGFTDFILTVSHMHEKIEEYFGNGEKLGIKIEYFVEETPLGNAGALFKLRDRIGSNPFLLLNADAVFDVDFKRMVEYHHSHGGLATILTHPNSHPYDSGLIISENDVVMKWIAKEDERPKYYNNRVNAGMHVLETAVLDLVDGSRVGEKDENGKVIKIDLDRQILKPLAGTGKLISYDSPEYVKDMGTPDRYYAVMEDFKAGRVKGKNLNFKQKAIFLDRDGTINKYVGFLRTTEEFELIDDVAEAIKKINASGYLAIVVTNQPVIARGEVTVDELETIHKKLETELGYSGAYIDALYYCPHHPHKGYEGEVPELKIDCDCRKPKPGLILRAAEKYNISLEDSYMIGDSDSDAIAGVAAGCQVIKIDTDQSILDVIEGIEESKKIVTVEQICPGCFKSIEKYGVYKCPHCDTRLSWRVTPWVKRT